MIAPGPCNCGKRRCQSRDRAAPYVLMVNAEQLKGLSAEQLHQVTLRLINDFAEQQRLLEAKDRSIETLTREVTFKSTKVDQLTHELAQ